MENKAIYVSIARSKRELNKKSEEPKKIPKATTLIESLWFSSLLRGHAAGRFTAEGGSRYEEEEEEEDKMIKCYWGPNTGAELQWPQSGGKGPRHQVRQSVGVSPTRWGKFHWNPHWSQPGSPDCLYHCLLQKMSLKQQNCGGSGVRGVSTKSG